MARNDELVEALAPDLVLRRDVRVVQALTFFYLLPGLRGLWSMSPINGSGNALDSSGHGRTLTWVTPSTFRPEYLTGRWQTLGTGYLHRTDEAGLDITGTESYVASAAQGLTWGGWFANNYIVVSDKAMMTKWNTTGNQRSYRLRVSSGNIMGADISTDGSAVTSVTTSPQTFTSNKNYFIVGRFTPSTELALFIQGTRYKFTNTASIPASVFNSTARLEIAAENAGSNIPDALNVEISFLCAAALSDAIIDLLFEKSRVLFDEGRIA